MDHELIAVLLVHVQLRLDAKIQGFLLINLPGEIAQACPGRPIHTDHHNHQ